MMQGVVSYRNSTSNHNDRRWQMREGHVVSYRNSTSNHNCSQIHLKNRSVVSYRNSTSNHNYKVTYDFVPKLYLIEILHQTTTQFFVGHLFCRLYLIEILHQTTTTSIIQRRSERCILSKFYIKPQLLFCCFAQFYVVSYRNSTSNHNYGPRRRLPAGVVSYRNSTSNHNGKVLDGVRRRLYLIEILHQTTTMLNSLTIRLCCILSKFYIKPQPHTAHVRRNKVVSYRNSTSNHN